MIITNNEEALRVKCDNVLPEEINELILTLESELNYANRLGKNGIGLAAPQIGITKNIAIIRMGNVNINLVNAKLEKGYDPAIFKDEGCLSFPGRVETTIRFQEIYLKNNLVYPNDFIATGLVAIACQHELDHLNSTLFMDHKVAMPTLKVKNKPRPNEPCVCGSKIKFKKCCGK
jgi:peptide deformylase